MKCIGNKGEVPKSTREFSKAAQKEGTFRHVFKTEQEFSRQTSVERGITSRGGKRVHSILMWLAHSECGRGRDQSEISKAQVS